MDFLFQINNITQGPIKDVLIHLTNIPAPSLPALPLPAPVNVELPQQVGDFAPHFEFTVGDINLPLSGNVGDINLPLSGVNVNLPLSGAGSK